MSYIERLIVWLVWRRPVAWDVPLTMDGPTQIITTYSHTAKRWVPRG